MCTAARTKHFLQIPHKQIRILMSIEVPIAFSSAFHSRLSRISTYPPRSFLASYTTSPSVLPQLLGTTYRSLGLYVKPMRTPRNKFSHRIVRADLLRISTLLRIRMHGLIIDPMRSTRTSTAELVDRDPGEDLAVGPGVGICPVV